MSITINPPPGPWTVEDLERVPDAGFRVEIHEGNLVIMSPATAWHSDIARRIANALIAAGQVAVTEVGIKRTDRSIRVADVAVFTRRPDSLNQAFWAPELISLVVEVVSDSSEDEDRFIKPRWYATAGVESFWRVERSEQDQDHAVIFEFSLARTVDGTSAYVESGVTTLAALEKGQGSSV